MKPGRSVFMALPVIGSTVMDAAYAAALPITEIYLGQLPRQVDDFERTPSSANLINHASSLLGWEFAGAVNNADSLSAICGNWDQVDDKYVEIGFNSTNIKTPICDAQNSALTPAVAAAHFGQHTTEIFIESLLALIPTYKQLGLAGPTYVCQLLIHPDAFSAQNLDFDAVSDAICGNAGRPAPAPARESVGFNGNATALTENVSIKFAYDLLPFFSDAQQLGQLCSEWVSAKNIDFQGNIDGEGLSASTVKAHLCGFGHTSTLPTTTDIAAQMKNYLTEIFSLQLQGLGHDSEFFTLMCSIVNVEGLNAIGINGRVIQDDLCNAARLTVDAQPAKRQNATPTRPVIDPPSQGRNYTRGYIIDNYSQFFGWQLVAALWQPDSVTGKDNLAGVTNTFSPWWDATWKSAGLNTDKLKQVLDWELLDPNMTDRGAAYAISQQVLPFSNAFVEFTLGLFQNDSDSAKFCNTLRYPDILTSLGLDAEYVTSSICEISPTSRPNSTIVSASAPNSVQVASSRLFASTWHAGFTTPFQGLPICKNFTGYESTINQMNLISTQVENILCGWNNGEASKIDDAAEATQAFNTNLSRSLAETLVHATYAGDEPDFPSYLCDHLDESVVDLFGLDYSAIHDVFCSETQQKKD